mmetsp:Transcript_12484/g.35553  ORF Transcript_12484/g.35553 Transcript_12484/m.35553 type:complete len:210 (+) Transcript_12484:846-1475(+)
MAKAWSVNYLEVGEARTVTVDLVEVQLPRPGPRLRARRHLRECAEERVDHRGLARVRPADEDHFGPLAGPVGRRLRVALGPLERRVLLGGAPAQEVDGHVVPGDAQLVHDLAGAQGLGHQAGPAVPADELVEGVGQHEEAAVGREGQDVVLDLHHILNLHGNLRAVRREEVRHVLRSALQVQAASFHDALDLAGAGGDVLRPAALPLQL